MNIPDITGVAAREFIAKVDRPADLVITDQQIEIYCQMNGIHVDVHVESMSWG